MGREQRVKEDRQIRVLDSIRGHDSTVAHQWNHTGGKCPKCLNPQHMLHFCCPNSAPLIYILGCELEGEHMHRVCAACKYAWVERCADVAEQHETSVEIEVSGTMAVAFAAWLYSQHGATIERYVLDRHAGWLLRMERDLESGRVTFTSRPPDASVGEIRHPVADESGG